MLLQLSLVVVFPIVRYLYLKNICQTRIFFGVNKLMLEGWNLTIADSWWIMTSVVILIGAIFVARRRHESHRIFSILLLAFNKSDSCSWTCIWVQDFTINLHLHFFDALQVLSSQLWLITIDSTITRVTFIDLRSTATSLILQVKLLRTERFRTIPIHLRVLGFQMRVRASWCLIVHRDRFLGLGWGCMLDAFWVVILTSTQCLDFVCWGEVNVPRVRPVTHDVDVLAALLKELALHWLWHVVRIVGTAAIGWLGFDCVVSMRTGQKLSCCRCVSDASVSHGCNTLAE